MLNFNSKEKLAQLIYDKIYMSSDNEFVSKVKEKIINEDKFTLVEFYKLDDTDYLIQLQEQELLWFVQAMEEVNPKIAKVNDYFTDAEIVAFKNYKKDKINIDDLYVLKNTFQLSERQYSCVASIEQIALMNKYGIVTVDPNFQRKSKRIGLFDNANELLRKVFVNKKRVAEISDKIINRKYKFNSIRYNLMKDGEFELNRPNSRGEIRLPKGGTCICIDGNHRQKACVQDYFDYPEMREYFSNTFFQIILTNFTAAEVRETISQEWDTEPVGTQYIEAMKVNMANEVVDMIKTHEKAEPILIDNIIISGTERITADGFISYNLLSDAINRQYKSNQFKLKSQAHELADWIVEFYNYLTVLFIEDFSNLKESKRKSWVTNLYTVYGFIYLSKILRNNDNWKEDLKTIINNINWNKENSPIINNKLKSNIPVVESFFEGILGDLNV